MRKTEEWYTGDGWYSDSQHFAFDYYNSYVIHPMCLECVNIVTSSKKNWMFSNRKLYDTALGRTKKYVQILERFISPEGTFPVFDRSSTYRLAVFQPLSMLAWQQKLPEELTNGQVRAGLTAVIKRMFDNNTNFNEGGYLTLGFNGEYADLSDIYTNNGSMYMTSLAFLPLGLPVGHDFWTCEPREWTQKKAWSGKPFPKDHAVK